MPHDSPTPVRGTPVTFPEAARLAREAQAVAEQRERERFIPRFSSPTATEREEAARRMVRKLGGAVSLGEARVMIGDAVADRRRLHELQTGRRDPDPVTGTSALDDPDMVRAFERGEFSFRRSMSILRGKMI